MGVWILAFVALAGVITAGVWGVKVLVSGPKGAGDQEIITNDGRNRVNAQEWFESQYAQILSADRNLDEAAKNLAVNPADDFWRANYTGLKNRCVDMVNAYNAEARKVSRSEWRTPDLPLQIDDSDSKTDCKETVR